VMIARSRTAGSRLDCRTRSGCLGKSHELSAARQRVALAVADGGPAAAIADEPTTALDVTVRHRSWTLRAQRRADSRSCSSRMILRSRATPADHRRCTPAVWSSPLRREGSARILGILHPRCCDRCHRCARTDRSRSSRSRAAGVSEHAGSGCTFEPRCPVREPRCRNETPELHRRRRTFVAATWRQAASS
jgi:hypothetical protein